MRCWLNIIFYLSFCSQLRAQVFNLQPVKGLPSEEVYDLLADTKGFIWAAHSIGLSRYDGVNFKDFNNPEATGAGITDLIEDKQGRIWCHNFNGQIFYVENEQMHLLNAYKYKEESFYPRMVILGDELLITSQKGLFVLDTKTLKSEYINNNLKNNRPRSISIVCNVAYIYDNEIFLRYKPQSRILTPMKFTNITNENFKLLLLNFQIQPINSSDTIYAKFNQNNIFKFVVRADTVILVSHSIEKSFLNTIICLKNEVWINAKQKSRNTFKKNLSFENYDISDIVEDREGNTWYSSLEKGLLFKPNLNLWEIYTNRSLIKNDQIRCFLDIGKTKLYGTQQGYIIAEDKENSKSIRLFKLPPIAGSVDKINFMFNSLVWVNGSVGIYYLDFKTGEVIILENSLGVRDIVELRDKLIFSSGNYVSYVDIPNRLNDIQQFRINILKRKFVRNNRCYGLTNNPAIYKILVPFNDGLFEMRDSIFTPILYQNQPIPASSLLTIDDKTFVTTFNKGLFVISKKGITLKTTDEGLLSNKILRLKQINGLLYIIEQKNMQVMDVATERIIKTVSLPTESAGIVYDVWQEDSLLYLSSNKSLYTMHTSSLNNTIIPVNYLLSISSDTNVYPINHTLILPYYQNNLQFKVISPSFTYPELTYFEYRIKGGGDSSWQQTRTNESNIVFAALKPGTYIFEAYAINFQNTKGKPIQFSFTILKPWWWQWWFIGINIIFLLSIFIYFFKLRLKIIKRKNDQVVEKLSLISELRKSQLATIVSQMNPHFIFNALNSIQGLIYNNNKEAAGEHIGKFSELIRNVLENSNNETITLGEEVHHLDLYLELEKMRFDEELRIKIVVDETLDLDNIMIPPILIQPYIENAIVHGLFHKSGDKVVTVYFNKAVKENYLEIRIDDNGIGRTISKQINLKRKKHISFATSAIEKRINLINQTLTNKIEIEIIDKQDKEEAIGTTVMILIPILNK